MLILSRLTRNLTQRVIVKGTDNEEGAIRLFSILGSMTADIRYYSGGFLIAIAVVVNLIFTIFTLAFSIKSKFKLYIHV